MNRNAAYAAAQWFKNQESATGPTGNLIPQLDQFLGGDGGELRAALEKIIAATHSHVDGRDLLAQLHPRNTLDIKRRVDARETWFEGDWLTDLWGAIEEARAALTSTGEAAHAAAPVEGVLRMALERLEFWTKAYGTPGESPDAEIIAAIRSLSPSTDPTPAEGKNG